MSALQEFPSLRHSDAQLKGFDTDIGGCLRSYNSECPYIGLEIQTRSNFSLDKKRLACPRSRKGLKLLPKTTMKVLGQLSHTERYLDQQTNVNKMHKNWLYIVQLRNNKNLPKSCRERQACGKRKKREEKNMAQSNHFHWSFTFSLSQSEEKNMVQANQWQGRLCEGNSNVLLVGLA